MNYKKYIPLFLITISSFLVLGWYFGLYGTIIALFWDALLIILTNLDRVADTIASSYKLGRNINFWFEKNAVKKRLETTINSASKKVNEESGIGYLPHGINIKWVETQNRETFLKENKIVICLESSYNEEKNLARATILFIKEDLIRESQRFVNVTIIKSLCFTLARKLLMQDRKLNAIKCLNEEFIKPEIQKVPQIRKYTLGMENVDKQGYLLRILLREFSQLDTKLSPAITDPRAKKETKTFTQFLINFIEREKGEKSELSFNGSVFRVSLMPVAQLDKDFDINNFVKAASHCNTDNIDTIYVLARGMNVEVAKPVISEIEKTGFYIKNKDWEYRIKMFEKPQMKYYVAELIRINTL